MRGKTLGENADAQLSALGAAIGLGPATDEVRALVRELLGGSGNWPLDHPRWPSEVADDHSPLEYSVAFDAQGVPTLRVLVECLAEQPSPRANQQAALAAMARLHSTLPLSLDRFAAVSGEFLPEDPTGPFSVGFSVVARPDSTPVLKVYLNPNARGPMLAPALVAQALDRLGFIGGEQQLRSKMRGLHTMDRYSFFALDLDDRPAARAKVYISHYHATGADVRRAATASREGNAVEVSEFCARAAGTDGPLDGRPLVSAYTFLEGDGATPSGYSLYVPVRDYVSDDTVALDRTLNLARRYGITPDAVRGAVEAVRGRDLAAGPGLIAHLSLRTGPPRPGMTVYLSAEGYGMAQPSTASRVGAA